MAQENGDTDSVQVGSTIEVDGPNGAQEFTIVGSNEADPLTGKISNESPMGQTFMRKQVKEEVVVKTPKGEMKFVVKKIS